MVGGMSGKSGEPRRGQAARPKPSGAINKPQPSVEAIQMAKILGDQHPSDLTDKVQQVRAVVPGRSEEEISVALHDHDYDCEKAITALLDSGSTQGEWTTSGRKGKKKGGSEFDFIVAPGDTKTKPLGRNSGSGTSKAASQSVRENYGGSVHVSVDGGRVRGRGRGQSSGRGRSSSSGRRGERPRDSRSSGRTGRTTGGSRERERSERNRTPQGNTGSITSNAAPAHPAEEEWGSPLQQTVVWTSSNWDSKEPSSTDEQLGQQWEVPETTPIFPDAIPPTSTFLPLASTAESSSLVATTTTSPESQTRQHLTPPTEIRPPETVPTEQLPSKPPVTSMRTRQRNKRIARSQIPTKPVEMPGSVDALDVEFGSLGIDFGGMESESVVEPERVAMEVPPPTHYEAPTQLQDSTSLLTVQHFSDDPGVISMSTVAPVESYQPPAPVPSEPKLEAPPGLTLPAEHQLTPPKPISLSQTLPSVTHSPPEGSSSASLVTQLTAAREEPPSLPLSTHASALPALSTEASLPPLPQSIEMPRSTAAEPTTRIEQGPQQLAPHSFSTGPSSTSGLQVFSSQPQAASMGTILTSSTNTRTSQSHHGGMQGKHGQQVHPNVVYQVPQVPIQYPFGMMHYYDPDMSRYQSVSMAPYYQHASSTDPTIASGAISRDHGATGFPGEGTKFGARGSDITSPVSSNPTQQPSQHQQGALQGGQLGAPAFYPYMYPSSFMYPTMGMPAGFSAPSMAPKPNAGSTYPGVSSYQPMPNQGAFGITSYDEMAATGSAHDQFSRGLYGNAKSSLPTASTGVGAELSSGYKHQQPYDGKGGSNYYLGGSAGGYMPGGFVPAMHGMPMHLPMVPHDNPQTRSQVPKHSKATYGASGLAWAHGSHTS